LGLQAPLYLTLLKGQYKQLHATIQINRPLTAPSTVGDRHGGLVVALSDKIVAERPLVALSDVQETHVLQQLMDYILLLFH
jgi:D-alanyl-D-alanine carboxypeptidase (penicillin-binding protein 5/6)